MSESELSSVRGAGISFNLKDFSLSGNISLTYIGDNDEKFVISNISTSRSDDDTSTYSDPYRLEIVENGTYPDSIRLAYPQNEDGLLKWQFIADWEVSAGSEGVIGGAFIINDFVRKGGSFSLSSPSIDKPDAIVFGTELGLEVGSFSMHPRGRDHDSEKFVLSGIQLSSMDEGPWSIADITDQKGKFRAVTEENNSFLQLKIDWPTSGYQSSGRIYLEDTRFHTDSDTYVNPATGVVGTEFSLGPSVVENINVQFLEVRFRPVQQW